MVAGLSPARPTSEAIFEDPVFALISEVGQLTDGGEGEITGRRQREGTSISDISTRTPPVDSRAMASKNVLASGVVTAKLAAS